MALQKAINNILQYSFLILLCFSCKGKSNSNDSFASNKTANESSKGEYVYKFNYTDSIKEIIFDLKGKLSSFDKIRVHKNLQKPLIECPEYEGCLLYSDGRNLILEYPLYEDGKNIYGKGRIFINEKNDVFAHLLIAGGDSTYEFFEKKSLFFKFHKSNKIYATNLDEKIIQRRNSHVARMLGEYSVPFKLKFNPLQINNETFPDIITLTSVLIYENPDSLSNVVTSVKNRTPLKYIKSTSDFGGKDSSNFECPILWYKVKYSKDGVGWVRYTVNEIAEYDDENW